MRRDGRALDHRTLETIRLMAVERVRDGESPSSVIASFGFSRTAIYRWIRAARKPGVGLKALHAKPATGRPRRLTPEQEKRVFRWINGRNPRQYGLDFGLWTRSVVATLIEQKFGVCLGLTAVGALLAKLGLTPQKPLQRAYQRDPQAIETWQREVFPEIARRAKAEGGEVYFWDESGFRARYRAWQDVGRERTDANHRAAWPEAIDQRGLGGECTRRLLVLHLSRRIKRRTVRHPA
jgi:transposase